MTKAFVSSTEPEQQIVPPTFAVKKSSSSADELATTVTQIRASHLLILGSLSALGPLSTDTYLPALPALSSDLGATMAQAQITLSAGILGLALGQIVAGPSSDAFGRRRPLLIGLAAFALASFLSAFAPSVEMLILLRFVQGFAGAAGIAIALAVVNDLYRGTTQARFFSLLTQISGLAPIIAPIIGSQLLGYTSWRGIFVAIGLMGILLLVGAAFGLGETLPQQGRQRGGLLVTLRTFRELLTERRFVSYALAMGFTFAAGISYISSSPFILQNLYGLSPQQLGIVFAVNAFGIVLFAQVSSRLVGRISPQRLLIWGAIAIAASGVLLLIAVLSHMGLAGILPALFLMVSSLGLIAPNATTLALAGAKAAGSASGLLGVMQLLIGALAAPLVGLAGNGSALPLAIAITGFGGATLVMTIVARRAGEGS